MVIIPDPSTLEVRQLDLACFDVVQNLGQREFGAIESTQGSILYLRCR